MSERKKNVVVRTCYTCGRTMEGTRQNYRYAECGLSSITLSDVLVFHCSCGAIVPEIPAIDDLHNLLAYRILCKDTLLSGEEIRFLRKMACFSATRLAETMAVTKEAVSRWENDKNQIGKESDRLVRFACFFGILRQSMTIDDDVAKRAFNFAKQASNLNLPEILQQIQDQAVGSKPLVISPEDLARYGNGGGHDGTAGGPGTLLQ